MHSATATASSSKPVEHALAALNKIVAEDSDWIGIHAAEALAAFGKPRAVHDRFLAEAEHAGGKAYRVGIWRVLALTAPSPELRAKWVAEIENVFLTLDAPDRKQAIESLAKLGHRTTGPVLAAVQRMAAAPPAMNTVLPIWSLHYSGDATALPRLIALLRSDDPIVRQRSAYALRWIKPEGTAVRTTLAQAAKIEPGGIPRVFVLSAALMLDADPAQRESWKRELEIFLHGDQPTGRLEAGYALAPFGQPADLPTLEVLLTDADHDTRVAAAVMILHLANRPAGPVK